MEVNGGEVEWWRGGVGAGGVVARRNGGEWWRGGGGGGVKVNARGVREGSDGDKEGAGEWLVISDSIIT